MGKNFDFDLDGAGMLDALIMAQAVEKDKDDCKSMARLIRIFHKYGLSTMQGMAMILELVAAVGGD